jgi:hypothetical protein
MALKLCGANMGDRLLLRTRIPNVVANDIICIRVQYSTIQTLPRAPRRPNPKNCIQPSRFSLKYISNHQKRIYQKV